MSNSSRNNLTRRAIFGLFFVALFAGCEPKRIDPPTFYHSTKAQSELASQLHANDVLKYQGIATIRLEVLPPTRSMAPLIVPGDYLVLIKDGYPVFPKSLNGKVITFIGEDGKFVTHGVVGADSAGLITAGYNNSRSDRQWVTEKTYIGQVIAIYRTDPTR